MLFATLDTDGRGVATVQMNRPEKRNAFDDASVAELTALFQHVAANPHIRVVVLSGSGTAFSAGADLHWMRGMKEYTLAENIADADRLADMFEAVARLPQPLIGRAHGAAIGGGSGLLAACDHVVALAGARFGFPEIHLGLLPATVSPYVIRRIGAEATLRYFLTGEIFTADRAEAVGLVDTVAADLPELDAEVERAVAAGLRGEITAGTEVTMLPPDMEVLPFLSREVSASPELIQRAVNLVREVSTQLQNDSEACRATMKAYTSQVIAALRVSDTAQQKMADFFQTRDDKGKVQADTLMPETRTL